MNQGQLQYPGEIRKFILGGNATFTVVFDKENDERRTYKVKSWKKDKNQNWSTGNADRSKFWVSLKTGSGDSFMDYFTIGVLVHDPICGEYNFEANGKRPGADQMFRSVWNPLERGCRFNPEWEFWHEGQCCICGRKLTVPSSIANGIGPECMAKAGM